MTRQRTAFDLEGIKRRDGNYEAHDPVQEGARSWRWLGILLMAVVAMILLALIRVALANEHLVGRASVIDGDTIEIHGERIRLWGVDAPEGRQWCVKDGEPWRCGKDSANVLADFLGQQTVTCTGRYWDQYEPVMAICRVAGRDVARWLVKGGWALDYARYTKRAYAPEQEDAQRARRGLWQGGFVPPWEWRKGERIPLGN